MATAALMTDARRDRGRAPGPRLRTPFGFLSIMRHDPLGFLLGHPIVPGPILTLRPRYGVPMTLHPRN